LGLTWFLFAREIKQILNIDLFVRKIKRGNPGIALP